MCKISGVANGDDLVRRLVPMSTVLSTTTKLLPHGLTRGSNKRVPLRDILSFPSPSP